jgi:2OG-Fe(II) oxygenase superfamily
MAKMLWRPRVWNHVNLDHAMASTVTLASAYVMYSAHSEGSFPMTKHVPDDDASCTVVPQRLFLTPLQCRTLERTGCLVVDDFLSPDELGKAARAARNIQSRQLLYSDNTAEEPTTPRTAGVIFTGIRSSSLAYFEPSYVGGTESVPDSSHEYVEEPALLHVRDLMRGLALAVRTSSFRGFDTTTQLSPRSYNDNDHNEHHPNGPTSVLALQPPPPQQEGMAMLGVPETLQLSLYRANHVVANYNAAHRDGMTRGSNNVIWRTGVLGYLRSQYLRQRYLTGILYLNDNMISQPWKSSDGGQLRIYDNHHDDNGHPDDLTRIIEDIEPRGGRLVLLSSESVLHSVQPSHRDRIACSIWFTRN